MIEEIRGLYSKERRYHNMPEVSRNKGGKEILMGLQDIILQKLLKVIDNTIGKKFKVVDDLTDLIQGSEGRLDDHEERIKKLEEGK